MEKIKERKLLLLWLPQVIIVAAIALALLFVWVPVFGAIMLVTAYLVAGACAIFSVIYNFYFYYQLSLDINAVCEGDGLETTTYLYVAVLNAFTLGIYGKYWIYKVGQRLKANAPRYGFKMLVGGKEILVLDIFSNGWLSAWEFVRNMNRIAKVYNQQGLPKIEGGVQ